MAEESLVSVCGVMKSDSAGVRVSVEAVRDSLVWVVTVDGEEFFGFVGLDGDFLVLTQRIPLSKVLSVSLSDGKVVF